MAETALTLLRADQKASGLTVREYERRYGLFLGDPGSEHAMGTVSDIRDAEVPLTQVASTIGLQRHCSACSRGLRNQRDALGAA